MTRNEALKIAEALCTTLYAMDEDHPEIANGVRLAAMSIAQVVSKDGKVDPQAFVRKCGIRKRYPRHHLEETYKGYLEAKQEHLHVPQYYGEKPKQKLKLTA